MLRILWKPGLVLAIVIFGAPVSAEMVGVSHCSQLQDGVHQPGLLTVEPDGNRTFFPVGENGLTEAIVFSERRALEWIAAASVFPADTVFGNYAGFACGMPCEDCAGEEVPAQEPEDPQEPTEPDTSVDDGGQ